MLQLDCTRRLSVDIDIVCPPGTDVISYLKKYLEEYGFGEIKSVERLSRNFKIVRGATVVQEKIKIAN